MKLWQAVSSVRGHCAGTYSHEASRRLGFPLATMALTIALMGTCYVHLFQCMTLVTHSPHLVCLCAENEGLATRPSFF